MKNKKIIELSNPLINHDSSCWKRVEGGAYELSIGVPSLLLGEDLDDLVMVLEEIERKRYSKRYSYGYYPSEDYIDANDLREYWARLGYECSDEEWAEWEKQTDLLRDEYGYYDNGETVWPPSEDEKDYYEGAIDYDPSSKKRLKKKLKKGGISSQKFINGIEVDDEEFEEYNKGVKSSSTRRGGKKHNKKSKRVTRYVQDEWDESHSRPFDDCTESVFYNEEKRIVFYRDLGNTADTYEWNNLHEFNEWLDENGIVIDERDISRVLYCEESHCCLNPEMHEDTLIIERSYGDLVWVATDGDESRMEEISDAISNRSKYI